MQFKLNDRVKSCTTKAQGTVVGLDVMEGEVDVLWDTASDPVTLKATRIEHHTPIEFVNPPPLPAEIRMVDPDTGGEKGSKLARFDLLPPDALWALAEHYGKGAEKYDDRNWEKGYDWSLSYAALQRHANEYWSGKSYDDETGSHHMLAIAFHAFALYVFETRGLGKDTR